MDVLSVCMQIAELAIWAIIVYYLCDFIGVPPNPKRVVQVLVVALAIFAALKIVLGGTVSIPRSYSMDRVPSIMTPEKR